jgi:hypothetical protein
MNSTMWKIAPRMVACDETYALINVAGLAPAIARSARAHPVRALRYE